MGSNFLDDFHAAFPLHLDGLQILCHVLTALFEVQQILLLRL